MSTFVGRLARTFSQGNDEGYHRRALSTSEHLDVSSHHPQEFKTKLSSSPSFNDFSLSSEADAAEEFGWLVPSFSLDNTCVSGLDDKSTIGLMSVEPRGDRFQSFDSGSTRMLPKIEAVSAPATAAVPEMTAGKMKRQTRIMGMDAYDFCDLIRTSSL